MRVRFAQRFFANGSFSNFKPVAHGVPQGSILGPLLFCVFINDLPLLIRNKEVNVDLFADDSTLSVTSKELSVIKSKLQESILDVDAWCSSNKMTLNPKKSKCMVISSRQMHQKHNLSINLKLDDEVIEQVQSHKVLGVIIDEKLSWIHHINFVQKKFSRNVFLLSRLKLFVSRQALKIFFHAHCLSHLNYASIVWCNADKSNLKSIERILKRGIRIMHNQPTMSTQEKFINLNMLTLDKLFKYNIGITIFKQSNGSSSLKGLVYL